jgi:RNA-binding proteins (RRM domain)
MKNLALANLFYYQNPITQQPSSHAISVQQICRVLCPATSNTSRTSSSTNNESHTTSTTKTGTSTSSSSSFLKETTMVLAYDPFTQTFDQGGWKAIRDVPILKEASCLWYYSTPGAAAASTSTQQSCGPISCRELAVLYYRYKNKDNSTNEENSRNEMAEEENVPQKEEEQRYCNVVSEDTRVWSPSPTFHNRQWTRIAELPDLMTAMEAFEDCVDLCVNIVDPMLHKEKKQEQNVFKPPLVTNDPKERLDSSEEQNANDLLLDFFSSTEGDGHDRGSVGIVNGKDVLDDGGGVDDDQDEPNHNKHDDDNDMEEYQSDGGTIYVKYTHDGGGGQWMKLDDRKVSRGNNHNKNKDNDKKRKQGQRNTNNRHRCDAAAESLLVSGVQVQTSTKSHKKPKFRAKNAKCWIYVTNLPLDTTEEEVAEFFKKVGVLELNPETQKPRVKLYREKNGSSSGGGGGRLKGDASICYARPESVDLALNILDDAPFRTVDENGKYIGNVHKIQVQRAKFEQHGEEYKEGNVRKVSDKKRKVARLAKLQAVGWDDGENGRITGGLKGLRIIVLKNVFDAAALKRVGDEAKEDEFLKNLETDLRKACDEFGTVEKITIFYKGRIDGVVIVKFTQPTAAGDAIAALNGKELRGKTMEVVYWDGVTDYTVHDHDLEAKEAEKRLDEFGHWLESQDLPEEFQLQVEGS